jgi:hypothetical protein
MNQTFSLFDNPFHIVRANYESSPSDISNLVEDAIFDGNYDESRLSNAQQSLVTPRLRLFAEVSYLPELSSKQKETYLRQLADGDTRNVPSEIDHLPELARANLLAHVLDEQTADYRTLEALINCWRELVPRHAFEFIEENRTLAGLPRADFAAYEQSLSELRNLHAKAAAHGIWQSSAPGELMNKVVEHFIDVDLEAPIFSSIVHEYDKASETKLNELIETISSQAQAIEDSPSNARGHARKIPLLLAAWDDINQPVQLFEQSRGHEEGRSKQIFNQLRSVCLLLANEHGDYESAKIISEALLHTFPELESIAEVLRKDVSDLQELTEQHKIGKKLSGLIAACETAKSKASAFEKVIVKGVFTTSAKEPLLSVLSEFSKVCKDKDTSEIAWAMVRDLGLFLNNERENPQASWMFLDQIIDIYGSGASTEIRARYKNDKDVAFKNWKLKQLNASKLSAGKSISIIDDLLKVATVQEATDLKKMRSKLVMRRRLSWGKPALFMAVPLFILGPILWDEMNSPPSRSNSTSVSTNSASKPINSTANSPSSTAAFQEIRPSYGSGLSFSRSQIRYCVFQDKRLEYIRPFASTNQDIDRFNALVDDYNSRCSDYRYYENDMRAVRNELVERQSQLQADARRIVAGW